MADPPSPTPAASKSKSNSSSSGSYIANSYSLNGIIEEEEEGDHVDGNGDHIMKDSSGNSNTKSKSLRNKDNGDKEFLELDDEGIFNRTVGKDTAGEWEHDVVAGESFFFYF